MNNSNKVSLEKDNKMVSVIEVKKEQEQVLYNLLQKYLYEMTQYYEDPIGEDGNFEYRYFSLYFEEPERAAYFIYDNHIMIGFAMINRHSFTNDNIENCIAEFTIFPAFRHSGNGVKAIEALKTVRNGRWQLKYSTDNPAGEKFWQKIKTLYHGQEQKLEGNEIAITFA